MNRFLALAVCSLLLTACDKNPETKTEASPVVRRDTATAVKISKPFTGTKVPVLCYHAIRQIEKGDGAEQKAYSVSPENFAAQIKALSENGYSTITPDQLREFAESQTPLPEKPIMITFDDGRKEQFTIGATTLEKYNFKGVFYIMTVALGKKRYMTRDDVKTLSDKGHVIGSHTWDHKMVRKYTGEDWSIQIAKPKKQLEEITKKPVTSFAYPNGVWTPAAADTLKSHGFTSAFLFGTKQDATRPFYTFERMNGPNIGNMESFLKRIDKASMPASEK